MSETDRLGWGSLQIGLFGLSIAALGTDIFSKLELLGMALFLMVAGMLGLVGSMALSLGVVGSSEEVIGR
jgi:hypothetical protein